MSQEPKAPVQTEAALKLTLAQGGQGAWPDFPRNDSILPGTGAGAVVCLEVPAFACSYWTFFFFFFWLRPQESPFMGLKAAAQTWRAEPPWV